MNVNAGLQSLMRQAEVEREAEAEMRKAVAEQKRREHRALVVELLRDKAIIAYDRKTNAIVEMVLIRPGNHDAAWEKEVAAYFKEWHECGWNAVAVYAEYARCGGSAITALTKSYGDAFASLGLI